MNDLYGVMTRSEVARMNRLLGGPIRRMRVLQDCPAYDLGFVPFLDLPSSQPEQFLAPMRPDTGPMSGVLLEAISRLP